MEILIGVGVVLLIGILVPSPLSFFSRLKMKKEISSLHKHLHTKMEIDAEGNRKLKDEIDNLNKQNENLRITVQTLKSKPGRTEIRLLHIYDKAINSMMSKSPGFAPAWQFVLQEAEQEMGEADQGVRAFVKKIFRPAGLLGSGPGKSVRLINQNETDSP